MDRQNQPRARRRGRVTLWRLDDMRTGPRSPRSGSDNEFDKFLENMRNNPDPPADVVTSAVLEEVAI
jgi:hypothetical protein